jgi:hypothetical protein
MRDCRRQRRRKGVSFLESVSIRIFHGSRSTAGFFDDFHEDGLHHGYTP